MSDHATDIHGYKPYIIVSLCLNVILLSCTSYIGYYTMKYGGNTKPPKTLLYTRLLFIMITVLSLFTFLIFDIYLLDNTTGTYTFILIVSGIAYVSQKYLILIVLFSLLYHIFVGTGLAFSTRTLYAFGVLFIITPIILIISVFLSVLYPSTTPTFGILVILLITVQIASFISLIIHKLYIVYNLMTNPLDRNKLVNAITKNTLLMVLCIITCIIGPCFIIMSSKSTFASIVSMFIIPLEIFVNFSCITLSFKCWNKHYGIMCRFCDSLCKSFWYNILQIDGKINQPIQEVEEFDDEPHGVPPLVAMLSNGIVITTHTKDKSNDMGINATPSDQCSAVGTCGTVPTMETLNDDQAGFEISPHKLSASQDKSVSTSDASNQATTDLIAI
eukprot:563852_1